ncbi:MAG: response regulator [Deltaproteobacteria bacterium]|nr:response regulator [Deltaproteobacteria bacterium]
MKILIVDDSAISRAKIREDLARGGYEIEEVSSGEEALQAIKRFLPDLVTMDVSMGGLDGYETSILLRAEIDRKEDSEGQKISLPIVMVTAHDTIEGRERGFEVGATEFIPKPFKPGELLARVDRLLRPEPIFKGVTVLVVDDSSLTRWAVSETLTSQGARVLEASEGRQALELARKNGETLDMIIADYYMPGLNGLVFLEKIRTDEVLKNVPVIMMSMVADREFILRMLKTGITDYLVKPFLKEELMARINIHLQARQLNRSLVEKVSELEELGKSKDEFLAVCSHDIRSPLLSILGYAELLAENGLQQNDRSQYLERIRTSGNHLTHLINELVDLGQSMIASSGLDIRPLSLKATVKSSLDTMLQLAHMKDLNLSLENPQAGDHTILGDRSVLVRILNNLISNAIKFSNHRGEVRISIGLSPVDRNYARIAVIDKGVGIPRDLIPKLFEKYSPASRKGTGGEKGTGLGLYIVKDLIGKLNGSVSLDSREGEGTTVTVMLPLAEEGHPG